MNQPDPAETAVDRIAEALYRHEWPLKQVWAQALPADRRRYEAMAASVLAAVGTTAPAPLPAPATGRRARYAAALYEAECPDYEWAQAHDVDREQALERAAAAMAVADAEQEELKAEAFELEQKAEAWREQAFRNSQALTEALAVPAAPVVPPAPTSRAVEDVLTRVREWVTSDVVTARNEFGNGYREAQRDISDLLPAAAPAAEEQPAVTLDLTDGPVRCPLCPAPVNLHTPSGARAHFTHVHPEQQLVGPGPWPLLVNRQDAAEEQPDNETPELAALFEGFGRLLATSSRDWGTYRVDAWLYAVILGWDCEQDVHDDTCTHGAMEEMQQMHGWSDEAVAKARRYRAIVRELTTPPAVVPQPEEAGLRCVCGDPIQLMDDSDPASWIHRPGSDTRCLEARPRCPHCQMPHDLTPGSLPWAACELTRQRIAQAELLHAEGDHSLCCRADCPTETTKEA